MKNSFKAASFAAATISLATAMPAVAMPVYASGSGYDAPGEERYEHGRKHKYKQRQDYRRGYHDARAYSGPTWRGRDGRYYCRKNDGTTGLLIGGAAGALLGRSIDNSGDRALGTILGAAGGALLGRSIDRNGSCR